MRVPLAAETVDLPLPPLVTIAGRVAEASEADLLVGLEDADGRHSAYGRPAPDGTFRFDGCPPGVYDVFLYARTDATQALKHRECVHVLAVTRVTANTPQWGVVLEAEL